MLLVGLLLFVQQGLAFKRFGEVTACEPAGTFPKYSEVELSTIKRKNIQQPFDHFDTSNTQTWNMTYYEQLDFWKPGGPLFVVFSYGIFIAKSLNIRSKKNLYYVELAEKMNGALFNFEHRYDVNSEILSMNSNFDYHTIDQSLADLVSVLRKVTSDPRFSGSKVVAMGPGVAGALAVWLRQAHPELVDAVYASDSPLLAQFEVPFNKIAGEDIKKFGPPKCYDAVEARFKLLEERMKTPKGREWIKNNYYACDDTNFNLKEDQGFFFSLYQESCVYQIGYYSPNTFCNNEFNITIKKDMGPSYPCTSYHMDLYIDMNKRYANMRAYLYPWANEFGWYDSVGGEDQPFGDWIKEDPYININLIIFNITKKHTEDRVAETNRKRGGLHPNVSHVVFVTGEQDPWRTLMVREDLSPEAPAVVIPKAPPCTDVYVSHYNSKETLEARKFVLDKLTSWISD